MPIRITCQNCGKAFSAWDDLVGKPVKCPKCQQMMVVPAANPVSPGERESRASGSAPASTPTNRPRPRRPAGAAGAPPLGVSETPATRSVTPRPPGDRSEGAVPPRPRPPATARPAAAPTSPSAPASTRGFSSHAADFDDSDELPYGCPNCDAPMPADEDLCNACGYHRVLKKVLDMDGIEQPDSSTGFERAVKRHLDDRESVGSMLFWLKALVGFVLCIMLLACFGVWGLLIFVVGLAAFAAWYFLMRKSAGEDDDHGVNRDPLTVVFWSGALWLQRTLNWRSLEPPFSSLRALTLHDPSFQDADLSDLEELREFAALDLEGTGLTNAGLAHLKPLKQLRFVVLRRTGVTAEGVQNLQQALPKAWIWH